MRTKHRKEFDAECKRQLDSWDNSAVREHMATGQKTPTSERALRIMERILNSLEGESEGKTEAQLRVKKLLGE